MVDPIPMHDLSGDEPLSDVLHGTPELLPLIATGTVEPSDFQIRLCALSLAVRSSNLHHTTAIVAYARQFEMYLRGEDQTAVPARQDV